MAQIIPIEHLCVFSQAMCALSEFSHKAPAPTSGQAQKDHGMAMQIRLKAPGGLDNLERVEVRLPPPDRQQILIRQEAAGVTFLDIYHPTALYPLPGLPGLPAGL